MELITIWHLLKRRWWLILLPAAVILLLTLPSLKNIVSPPVTYSVQLRLTAAAPPDAEIEGVTTPYEDSVYVPLLASEYVVVTLSHWITSDSFAREVSAALEEQNISIAAGDLQGIFHADSFRSILTLYVDWDDATQTGPIAETAVNVLQNRNQDYFPQFAAVPVEVILLDEVEVNKSAPPITTRIAPLLRILIGLAAGVGLAVMAEYLDTTIHNSADVEVLGLQVIAEIPPER